MRMYMEGYLVLIGSDLISCVVSLFHLCFGLLFVLWATIYLTISIKVQRYFCKLFN